MSRDCKKCGKHVPKFLVVDGKKRNCQRRKYCFECSPFGEHNTSKLETVRLVGGVRIKQCPDCGKDHYQKGNRCFVCYFNLQQKQKSQKVSDLIGGYKCWKCGYDKTKLNLHFHHVGEGTKLFGLTTRELMLKWEKVEKEIRKCVLLCGNCHGEVHCGLISLTEIEIMWNKHWHE